jgi:hypothetical protein
MGERKFTKDEMAKMAAGTCIARIVNIRQGLERKDEIGTVTVADVDKAESAAWDAIRIFLNAIGHDKVAIVHDKLRGWRDA